MPRLTRKPYRRKSTMRRMADWLSTLIFLLLMAAALAYFLQYNEQEYSGTFKVVDGDSLEMADQRFRLIGIDAPEYLQLCQDSKNAAKTWTCGKEAANFLRKLVIQSQKQHDLICKGNELDKYGRVLARCFSMSLDLNGHMVRNGWAVAYGDYFAEEREAKSAKLGVWAGDFMRPEAWRREHADVHEKNPAHNSLANIATEDDDGAAAGAVSRWVRKVKISFLSMF